ncbi:unnamed protein product [Heligmosomoides polygyrus]|uniref:TIL domain-containing protein n=1 Tax=Heligmosomoides polygyrus TaxID=6339 RepID=A0A3P8CVY8_HELPZ|nr:unnamed protein product [Heligmosomoides polygyrus]
MTASLASVSPIGRCLDSEVYSTCGTACEPSCKNPNPQICTLQCVIGCQCRKGFFRDDQKVCVAKCPDTIKPCSAMNCPPGTNCVLGRVICPFVPPCFTRQTECVPFGTPTTSTKAPPQETCATKYCPSGTECQQDAFNCVKAPCPPGPPPKCVPKGESDRQTQKKH